MAVTKMWKVYGVGEHRQKMSFEPSVYWDWTGKSKGDGTRIFEALNSDKTGTNEYTIIRITRDTEELCDKELSGQITDGYFENARVGKIVEINTIDDIPEERH